MSHIWSFNTGTIINYFKVNLIDNPFEGNFIDNISRIERKYSEGNFIDSTFIDSYAPTSRGLLLPWLVFI